MRDFRDREKAFENKFKYDEETKFKVLVRRSKLLGLWAAEKMGLSGDEAEAYAKTVVVADLEEAGDEDLFRKVFGDFEKNEVGISENELRETMVDLLHDASEEVLAE